MNAFGFVVALFETAAKCPQDCPELPPSGCCRPTSFRCHQQQSHMESLIDGVTNKEKIYKTEEDDKDEAPEIAEWKGMTFDKTGHVIQVNWSVFHLEGTIDLKWLPPTVRMFFLWMNHLSGPIDISSLPPHMHVLDLSKNKFSGDIDLCHMPDGMGKLDVAFNHLNGSLNLEKLPNSLLGLMLNNNEFSGTVSLRSLPEKMEVLNLHTNKLTGEIDLTNLPSGMKRLYLAENNFEGEPDFTKLPKTLSYLDIIHIWLPGEVVLAEDESLAGNDGKRLTFDTLVLVAVVIVAVMVLSLLIWGLYIIVKRTMLRAGNHGAF